MSRWNGSVTVRFESFPTGAQTIPLSRVVSELRGEAELEVDRAGRITALRWPDECDAPEVIRLAASGDTTAGWLDLWFTEAAADAETRLLPLEGDVGASLGKPSVHVGAAGDLLGLRVPDAAIRLPERLMQNLSDAPTGPPDTAATSSQDAPASDVGNGLYTIDHRVATDEIGEETFTFHAGLLSWETFVADLQQYAHQQGLSFRFERERGALWGLLGVEVTCVVEGRFSAVTDFAEYARARMRLWRDGDLAG